MPAVALIVALAITHAACSNKTPAAPAATQGDSAAPTVQVTSEPPAVPIHVARVVGGTAQEPGVTALATFEDEVWIAIGTVIIAAEDRGTRWARLGEVESPPNALSFTSPQDGWASTEGGLLRTADGGRTWSHIGGLPPGKASRVRFADPMHGWLTTADGGLQRTIDGGDSWGPAAQACGTEQRPSAGLYAFADLDQGWTLCKGGAASGEEIKSLFASDDGGTTWNLVSRTAFGRSFDEPTPAPSAPVLPSGGYASDLFFLDDKSGWISASRAGLYATTAGGQSWRIVRMEGPAEQDASAVTFATPSRGYILAQGVVWRTDDAGQTWSRTWGEALRPFPTVVANDVRLIPGFLVYAVARIDDAHLWVVADRCRDVYHPELQQKLGRSTFEECEHHPRLMHTDDGGQGWTAYELPGVVPDDIRATDAEHLVARDHSAFYLSSDGGTTWIRSHADLLTGKLPLSTD